MDPQRQLALEFSDMLRVSLAGNLKDLEAVNAPGELVLETFLISLYEGLSSSMRFAG